MAEDLQELLDGLRSVLATGDENALSAALATMRAADIAEIIDLLDDEERYRVIWALDSRSAATVVSMLDEAVRGEVVEDLPSGTLEQIVTELPPDDAADVLGELPPEQSEALLEQIPEEKSRQIEPLLRYGPDTAGGIMTPRFVAVGQDATVSQAVAGLRKSKIGDSLIYVYVTDERNRLTGVVPLRQLVTAPPGTPVRDVMLRDVISVRADEDQESVANLFRRYDLAAVPVLDEQGHLLGRITYDDVMDVAQEEAAEDLYRMAGTDAAELATTSVLRAASVRARWLVPCLVGTLVSMVIILIYSSRLGAEFKLLFAFVPMIAAMGGNAGVQTSTIIVRGLATEDFSAGKVWLAFAREIRIALVIGLTGGVLAGLIGGVAAASVHLHHSLLRTGVATGMGMALAILVAASLGISLPFLFRRTGVDPAIASGPLITTANDVISVTIYLSLAMLLIG